MAGVPKQALPAIGTLLQIGNGASPEVFNSIANIGDITGPGTSAAVVDVTSHTSVSAPWRSKIPTLLDAGDITLPLYVDPSSGAPATSGGYWGANFAAGLGRLFANRGQSPGVPYNFKIIYIDGTTDEFQGFITKYSRKSPVAGVYTADVTITITGVPSFA